VADGTDGVGVVAAWTSADFRCRWLFFTGAWAAAGRVAEGIPNFPGPKDSPRAGRFRPWLPQGSANFPPPAAGGLRWRRPTRRSVLFFWTVHGPFSFRQDRKENGGALPSHQYGWIPRAVDNRPYGVCRDRDFFQIRV